MGRHRGALLRTLEHGDQTRVIADRMRPRLQLALGPLAELGDERPSLGGRRRFEARARADGAELLVTLHPSPPQGPSPDLLLHRVRRIAALAHPALLAPVGSGVVDECAWIVEPALDAPSALFRLDERGAMSLREGVATLRDVTRALVTLHRAGLPHGAIDLDTLYLTPDGARLGGLGLATCGTVRDDLGAIGAIAWACFTGDLPDGTGTSLARRRRGVPAALDALVASLLAPEPAARPANAEAVLLALDGFPTPRPSPLDQLFDGAGRGGRAPRARELLFALGLVGLGALITTLLVPRLLAR